ncbi:hypothetical protein GSD1FS_0656 [Bifidobacterium sp. GSD1FS]|uniref:Uncharacterized protein n=1 Tax=Bifidobacterium canis TaxID=2610880 RepID=A0A7K1J4G0_9BIFI|nr:hypothetical protein [Bifidobacterium canis]
MISQRKLGEVADEPLHRHARIIASGELHRIFRNVESEHSGGWIRPLHSARIESLAATGIEDRAARAILRHRVEHCLENVLVITAFEHRAAVLERLFAVVLRLLGCRHEIHIPLLRDVEGVAIGATQTCAAQSQFFTAQRADEVAFGIGEPLQFRRTHALIVKNAVQQAALTYVCLLLWHLNKSRARHPAFTSFQSASTCTSTHPLSSHSPVCST